MATPNLGKTTTTKKTQKKAATNQGTHCKIQIIQIQIMQIQLAQLIVVHCGQGFPCPASRISRLNGHRITKVSEISGNLQ